MSHDAAQLEPMTGVLIVVSEEYSYNAPTILRGSGHIFFLAFCYILRGQAE
jgi:hypothetical protein